MDDSSASTSADPLTLPSSPLVRHHSPRKVGKPLRSRSPNKQQFSSPAKSFIMDTGDAGAEQSPWRIKVTVQAEPRNSASPSKKAVTKTTTVPLKGGSSSPAKRPARRKKTAEVEDSEMEVEIKRPQRKRKGTPIRRAPKRPTPAKVAQEEEAEAAAGQEHEVAVLSSPSKKPAKRGKRRSLGTMTAQRGQRLSQARDELDEALQDAVGEYDGNYMEGDDMLQSEAMHGDMTAMNEDFTMVSVETLQSMKQNTSMLEDSQISNADKSAVAQSYWPSSPPNRPDSARRSTRTVESASNVDYPDISAQAQYARDTPAKSFVQAFDAMSWKPTGRAAQEPTPAESSELQDSSVKKRGSDNEPGRSQRQREQVGQRSEQALREDVVVVEDEPEAELGAEASDEDIDEYGEAQDEGGDGDIWAEEASRSLEEDVDTSHVSNRSNRSRTQQPKPTTAEQVNDLFSGMPSKLPRAKIPRTWRRSSGMDFQYSDSPAHSFAREEEQHLARKSSGDSDDGAEDDEGERGSGVLTPPSTEEDDDDEHEVDDEEGMDEAMQDDAGEDEEVGANKSVFEPDAAATELQLRNANRKDDASDSGEDDNGDDTGLFWQNNLPSVYANKRPIRPRIAEQRKARDLSELLRENESSHVEANTSAGSTKAVEAKKPSDHASAPAPAAKRFPGSRLLAARREAASSSFTSTSSAEHSVINSSATVSAQKLPMKEKPVSSPLRKSLLKSSKVGGARTEDKAAEAAAQEAAEAQWQERGARRPADRDQRESTGKPLPVSQSRPDVHIGANGEGEGNTSISFASKASDQRQLLEEFHATPAAKQSRTPKPVSDAVEESLWGDAGQEIGMEGEEVNESGDEEASPARSVDYSSNSQAQYTDEVDSEDETNDGEEQMPDADHSSQFADTTRSYEEHLNLSSPQKIRVNFGSSTNNSSLLAPKRDYPPLFSNQRPPSRGHQFSSSSEHIFVAKPQSQSSEPGLLSRLTTTLWTALIRPSGPITEPVFPAPLRAKLRSRYGVLSNRHPWTMAHMRTLHRMLNSATGKRDSIIPKPGQGLELPSSLLQFAGKSVKMKDTCGRSFVMTELHAYVVYSFLQLLVPHAQIAAMEAGDIDFIGDSMARELRAYWDEFEGRLRHGSDLVWAETDVVGACPREGSTVGVEWVVRCLGACVLAQGELEVGL